MIEHSETLWTIDIGHQVSVAALSMGNPHAVQVVVDIDTAPVTTDGPLIERHQRFPKRVNAGFMQIINRHRISLRVWERGAGETPLLHGSLLGRCAVSSRPARLRYSCGARRELTVDWQGPTDGPDDRRGDSVTDEIESNHERVDNFAVRDVGTSVAALRCFEQHPHLLRRFLCRICRRQSIVVERQSRCSESGEDAREPLAEWPARRKTT